MFKREPLVILRYFEVYSREVTKHLFWPSRPKFTLKELKEAQVISCDALPEKINAQISRKKYPHILYVFRNSNYRQADTNECFGIPYLECERFYPYGNSSKPQIESPKKGRGIHFELKVLKFLALQYPENTRVLHDTSYKGRVDMLAAMGISPRGSSHTLGSHMRLYEEKIEKFKLRPSASWLAKLRRIFRI